MPRLLASLLITTALCSIISVATLARAADEAALPTSPATAPITASVSKDTSVMQTRFTVKDVKVIQQILASKGFYKSAVDGQFGPGTQDSLRQYQSAQGLEANGYPTAATVAKLGVTPENAPVFGGETPPGTGGVVYTETTERKQVAETARGPAGINTRSVNGGSCLHCSNGPIGNGGTASMHSNEY